MFSKFELTNKGVELLNRVIAEQKTLKFTKFQIGKGDFSGDKKTLTQLVSKIDEFNVSQTNVLADGITNIKGFYDNRNLSVASKLTEIGIMAQLGDDNLTEVLFSYSNQPSAEAETIPSKESYFSRTFSVMNRTDNVTSVTFDLTIRQDKYNFGTLAEMKAADYLDVGDKVTLWGNAALGDSSFKMYIIADQTQPIQLNNKLYAKEYFAIVNDLVTGGANKAGSAEMIKKLGEDKQNKTDNELETDSKKIVGAINESLWRMKYKSLGVVSDFNKIDTGGIYSARVEEGALNAPPINFPYSFIIVNITIGSLKEQIVIVSSLDIFTRRYTSSTWGDWVKVIKSNTKEFLGNAGISSIVYIQDSGTKTKDNGYIDKDTGKLYIAKETNTDVTVTKKFRLATNIENAKEPTFIDVYTKKSINQNVELTIISDSDLSNYSQFDEIEFIADIDGSGECSSYKITIGAVLKAYDTASPNTQDEGKGRIVFWMPDSANRIEIKKKLGVGIIVKNNYSNWYLANCRIIKHY